MGAITPGCAPQDRLGERPASSSFSGASGPSSRGRCWDPACAPSAGSRPHVCGPRHHLLFNIVTTVNGNHAIELSTAGSIFSTANPCIVHNRLYVSPTATSLDFDLNIAQRNLAQVASSGGRLLYRTS